MSQHMPRVAARVHPDVAHDLMRLWWLGQSPNVHEFLAAAGPLTPDEIVTVLQIDQRARWERGQPVLAEAYFEAHPELRTEPERAIDLIYGEFLLREELGESPTVDEYIRRFPDFAEALRLQVQLHQAVESDEASETNRTSVLLSANQPGDAKGGTLHDAGAARAPWVPEGYEILSVLGRGGMGVVYKARQRGLNRIVALKMIRIADHAGAEQLARFRTEAEMVALLQHPNIVQVYEVGKQGGQPYFSLEYVDGGNLAQRIAGHPQTPRHAAQLIEALARAMHYAHQRGVVHRDLKPANILLRPKSEIRISKSEANAKSEIPKSEPTADVPGFGHSNFGFVSNFDIRISDFEPKISDFGLARHLEAGSSLHTKSGDILGTPEYMAPEQAGGQAHDAGPAVDIYALGAILYELLTGRRPFQAANLLDTLEMIRKAEPVPPRRLQPKLPLDLDTITLKCLEKDPKKRYASAGDLADDLERFLAARPIKARRISPLERGWRWCRRNPLVAALVAAVFLSMIGGTVVAWILALQAGAAADDAFVQKGLADVNAQQARQEQKRAETSLKFARESLTEMTSLLVDDLLARQETLTDDHKKYLRRVLALTERLAQDAGNDEQTRDAVAQTMSAVGSIRLRLGQYVEAETALRRGAEAYQKLAGDFPTAPHPLGLARALNNLGLAQIQLKKRREAEESFRASLKAREPFLGEGFEPVHRHEWAKTHVNLSNALRGQGHPDEADRVFDIALKTQEELAAAYPKIPEHRQELARCWTILGTRLAKEGKRPAAEKALRAGVAIQDKLAQDFPKVRQHRQDAGRAQYELAELLRKQKKFEESERTFRLALAYQESLVGEFPGSPDYRRSLALTLNDMALIFMGDAQRVSDAEPLLRRAVELRERLLADGPDTVSARIGLGGATCNLGYVLNLRDPSAALPVYDRAVKVLAPAHKAEPSQEQARRFLRNAHHGRADTLTRLNRHKEAMPDWDQAVALVNDVWRDRIRAPRAVTLARLGEIDRAAVEAHALAQTKGPPGETLYELARVHALCAAATTPANVEAYAAEAVNLLRRAAAAGYKDFARVDTDADFNLLRGRADFKNLRPLSP